MKDKLTAGGKVFLESAGLAVPFVAVFKGVEVIDDVIRGRYFPQESVNPYFNGDGLEFQINRFNGSVYNYTFYQTYSTAIVKNTFKIICANCIQ